MYGNIKHSFKSYNEDQWSRQSPTMMQSEEYLTLT